MNICPVPYIFAIHLVTGKARGGQSDVRGYAEMTRTVTGRRERSHRAGSPTGLQGIWVRHPPTITAALAQTASPG
jgi:hypothetical protein